MKSWSSGHWQWISPGTAAVEWFLIMNLLSLQLQSLQSIMRFDCALHVATYFSQNIVPQQSGCTCRHLCLLHWPEAWIQRKNNSRLVHGIMKTMGHETTRTVVSVVPRSWWGSEQSVFCDFNQSMTGDWGKCASLMHYLCIANDLCSHQVSLPWLVCHSH